MAKFGKFVNKQFNSPINLYSDNNIREVLGRESQILDNGAKGINFANPMHKPANLQHSAVLRFLEEEEQRKRGGSPSLKRVAWPPPAEAEGHLTEVSLQDVGGPQISSPGLQNNQVPSANYQQQGQECPQLSNQHHPVVASPYKPTHQQVAPQLPSYQPSPLSPLSISNASPSGFTPVQQIKQWAPVHSPIAVSPQPKFPSTPQQYQPPSIEQYQPPSQHYQPHTQQQYQPPSQHYQPPPSPQPHQQYQPSSEQYQPQPQLYQNYQPQDFQQYQPPPQQYQPPPQQYQPPTQQYQPPTQQYQPPQQQYQPPQQHQSPSEKYQLPPQQYQQSSQQYQPSPQQYQPPPQQYQPPPQQYQPPPQQYEPPPQQHEPPPQQYKPPPQQYQPPPQQYQPPAQQYQPPPQQYQPPPSPQTPKPIQQSQTTQTYSQPSTPQQPLSQPQFQAAPATQPQLAEQQQQQQQYSQPQAPPQQQHHYQQQRPGAGQAPQQRQIPSPQPQVQQQQPVRPAKFVEPPPSTITLRPEAPVSQAPAPVITSQPATATLKGGKNLRGDLKWPPPETKEKIEEENRKRIELARGPVCRPRRVNRDYTGFFAQHALNASYPGYKVPPGTQFYVQEHTP